MKTNLFYATRHWIDGELLEGIIVAFFGIVGIVIAVALWNSGKSPAARSLVVPILICGLVYTGIGLSIHFNNRGLKEKYSLEYQSDPEVFIVKEKKRVEDFQYMYKISKVVATVTFLAAILIFWLTKSPAWQGIGIGLGLFGLAGLLVDFFSQHRAMSYYQALLAAMH